MSYIQRELADIWKENILEDLGIGTLKYAMVEEFLVNLKREFSEWNNETMKVVELKKVKQENKTMEKFVQKFKIAVRESSYEKRSLVKEFKREMNETIRRKLIETERLPKNIEKWYERTTNLNRY